MIGICRENSQMLAALLCANTRGQYFDKVLKCSVSSLYVLASRLIDAAPANRIKRGTLWNGMMTCNTQFS